MEITSKRFTSAAKTMPSNRDQRLERQQLVKQLEVQEGHLHRQERERPRDRRKRRKRHRHVLSGQEVGGTPLGLVQR